MSSALPSQKPRTCRTSSIRAFNHLNRRSGAAAEVTLHDIVSQLQEHWRGTFQGAAVVWRMWPNHITRKMNRSTWINLINQAPPDYASLNRSAQLALDCVAASIADNAQLQSDVEAIGGRLEIQKNRLQSRKDTIEAFIRDILPPVRHDIVDPLPAIDNVADLEHEE
ncbi:hypothetical protein JG687_00009265 [Phytophthora cactorum]|uniref:Uncharacterized protein n=1 Tax=Phytophthora cactorum TaxID=29920 RepID=A0A8T1UD73_9STRA|nr:hypothetical protein JG687_00009265 [Phytophthora cactorum]